MLRRLARTISVVFLVMGALLFAGIKGSMWMTRLHVKHLLADFQSIQPMQSNWADAQHLMRRWGRWGHYDDACTATDCSYTIDVEDGISQISRHLSENAMGAMLNHGVLSALGKIGWHATSYSVSFTVQDGVIVRTHTSLSLEVAPHFVSSDWNNDYALLLKTQVYSRLTTPAAENGDFARILGPEGTPSDHPDYKVGRPDGCTICMAGELTYTPTLAHSEIVRLTAYNLSCITAWRQCKSLEDLLPAASAWHLYTGWDDPNYRPPPPPLPVACIADPRALGRDADVAVEADVLSSRIQQFPQLNARSLYPREIDTIRVKRVLKGSPVFAAGQQIEVAPHSAAAENSDPRYVTEHLHSGTQAILFFDGPSSSAQIRFETPPCGGIEDTPDALSAVILGISQDVLTRHGDTRQ